MSIRSRLAVVLLLAAGILAMAFGAAGANGTTATTDSGVILSDSTTTTLRMPSEGGFTIGFDIDQPFRDVEAPTKAGMKILTSYVAVGNRLDTPLPFSLKDLVLEDPYGNTYQTTVAPIWKPALAIDVIGPREVVGGYVSWEVPFYVWPCAVAFTPEGRQGLGRGWQMPIYTDVNSGYRFYWEIGALKYRGTIGGYPDGTFRPDKPILREQFAKMILLAASPDGTSNLTYPEGFLEQAVKRALLPAGKEGRAPATRLEVAVAVAKIGQLYLKPTPEGYILPFTDIPTVAQGLLALLASNGVISGTSATTFSPDALCTRGQAARMVQLMLNPTRPIHAPK
jgi:hypothetical protein